MGSYNKAYPKARTEMAIFSDPYNKLNPKKKTESPVPARQRQKKTVDSGKGVSKGEAVGGPRAADREENTGNAARLNAYLRTASKAAKKMGPEKVDKVTALAKKRNAQRAEDKKAGIYRENYMSQEAYDNFWKQRRKGKTERE